MFRSIRSRLVLWYTGIIVLTFIGIAWTVKVYVERTLSDSLDQSIESQTKWIAAHLLNRLKNPGAEDRIRDDIFEHAAYYPIKEYIEIWDSTGKIFYRSPNLEEDTLKLYYSAAPEYVLAMSTIHTFRTHNIRLAVQRTDAGTIFLAMPTESISIPVRELIQIFILLVPIVIIVSVVGGTYLAKKSFSSVNRIIDTAKRITADRLHDRIPEHNVQDEIGRLISTFNEMIARLDSSFQQMKQLSADASHELRTPLAVIRAQLEDALTDRVPVGQLKKIAANCLDETLHMSAIVENLLLLAKADAGRAGLKKERVNIKALMQQMYEESVILASQRSIRVSIGKIEDAEVIGDEQRLRQMFLNLIDNAIKYNKPKGKIELAMSASNGVVSISVTDTGIGIDASDLEQIFDRFYRVDKARGRQVGGAGLGLSIARWAAEAHAGSISVRSELHKGSRFTVTLPRVTEP